MMADRTPSRFGNWIVLTLTGALVPALMGAGTREATRSILPSPTLAHRAIRYVEFFPIRLAYFYAEGRSDPMSAPNPHVVKLASSKDGIHFTNARVIFSANNLIDPDLFRIPSEAGGGYGLIYTADMNLHFASSTRLYGEYVVRNSPLVTGGQSSTQDIGGQLTTFISGIHSAPLSISSAGGASFDSTRINRHVITHSDLGVAEAGVIADPSIVTRPGAEGGYRAFVKYDPGSGTGPRGHQLWTLTSSDGVRWTNPRKLRDSASVPGALRKDDKLFVYFVDFSGEYSPYGSLAVGLSHDGGETFEYSTVYLDERPIQSAYDPTAITLTREE